MNTLQTKSDIDPIFLDDDRVSTFPSMYPTITAITEKQRGCIWGVKEIDFRDDAAQWATLDEDEQKFITGILAFFAGSDLIVNKNLITRFMQDVKPYEFQAMYRIQTFMEDIHSEVYARLLHVYISDDDERKKLFNAIKTVPIVKEKAAWAEKWIASDRPYKERLIAFAAVEGILFSGSFCAIFWIRETKKKLKALTISNDYISRDEGLHVDGAVEIHKLLRDKASETIAHEIIKEAVELEGKFISEILPKKLIGINASSMLEHIKFVANRLLRQLGYAPLYPNITESPFAFMNSICLTQKSNFFEVTATQYNQLASNNDDDPWKFDV